MSSISEDHTVWAKSNHPTELAAIRVNGGYHCDPGEFWIKFYGHDGSIFELFASEIREILERFRFDGTTLERLWAVYQWANSSWEYQQSWLAEPASHG